jgi:hypothetical protein
VSEKEKQYLFFKALVEERKDILKKIFTNPKEVLKDIGISEESLTISPIAHEALKTCGRSSKKEFRRQV